MGDRYRLPEVLGGGECEEAAERSPVAGWIHVRALVGQAGPTPATWASIHIRQELLTKVDPAEPANSEVVLAGRAVFWRDDAAAEDEREPWEPERWFRAGATGCFPWSEVCKYGTPVRLVPDPAVGVELPWNPATDGPLVALHSRRSRPDFPIELALWMGARESGRYLSVDEARGLIGALAAAADAAEAANQ